MIQRSALFMLAILVSWMSGVFETSVFAGSSEKGRRRLAYTDPQRAGEDFAWQGEYLGSVLRGGSRSSSSRDRQSVLRGPRREERVHLGLQVIAQGDGRFLGVAYPGGLPGSGFFRGAPVRMRGGRDGGLVVFEGNGRRYEITPMEARVYETGDDRPATPEGRLSADPAVRHFYNSAGSRLGRLVGRLDKVRRVSPTLGMAAPPEAIVIFDGLPSQSRRLRIGYRGPVAEADGTNQRIDISRLRRAKITDDGLLQEGAEFDPPSGDFRLHLEFRLPYMPFARGQGRGNSGVYLLSRYEVQILDSFGLTGEANECGGLYRQRRPDLNMCLPPLAWQTYDIEFTAPRFDAGGNKRTNARITVRHNGMVIHDDVELTDKTGSGRPEGPELLPIRLQDHGNPVRFRNIWIVDRSREVWSASPAVAPGWTAPGCWCPRGPHRCRGW